MRSLALIATACFLMPLLPPALASTGYCPAPGYPTLGRIEVGDGTAAHTFYVDDRGFAFGNGIWIYEETNGIFFGDDAARDLQRGGDAALWPPALGNDSEICTDDPNVVPDTFFF